MLFLAAILVASGTFMISPAAAQVIATPSAPEFSIKVVGDNIEIEIQNQPIIDNGQDTAGIFFDRRIKWHESSNWHHPEPDPADEGRQYISQIGTTGTTRMITSANSFYEILGNTSSQQLDIQYQAINGYLNRSLTVVPPIGEEPGNYPVVVVNTSEWSETRTITLPQYTPETPTPTPSPSISPSITPTTSSTQTPQPTTTSTQTPQPSPTNEIPSAITTIILGLITVALIIVIIVLIMIYKKIQKPQK